MRFFAEDTLASEIAEMIKRDFDYNSRTGYREFSHEVEFEDEIVCVEGSLDYAVGYEEDVNYSYISSVSVGISDIKVYDNEGDEVKSTYNDSKVAEYIKEYLTE